MGATHDDFLLALARADSNDDPLVGSSIRIPASLRDAIRIGAELGISGSLTEMTTACLRNSLAYAAEDAALEAHYEQHPNARPSTSQVALAVAEMRGSIVADYPDLLDETADQVEKVRPEATGADVVLVAEVLLSIGYSFDAPQK